MKSMIAYSEPHGAGDLVVEVDDYGSVSAFWRKDDTRREALMPMGRGALEYIFKAMVQLTFETQNPRSGR